MARSSTHPRAFSVFPGLLLGFAALLALPAAQARAGGNPRCEWSRGFHLPGLNGTPKAALTFDDGDGAALYVGGEFNSADGERSVGMAKWDGRKWSSFFPPSFRSGVAALAAYDNGSGVALVAADGSTSSGSAVARWNGTAWVPMGQIFGQLYSLAVVEAGGKDVLYVGGAFHLDQTSQTHQVARWNGSSWTSILSSPGAYVDSLLAFDAGSGPRLHAGGCLHDGGSGLKGVAMWNGLAWSNLGAGLMNDALPGCTTALEVFDDGGSPALAVGGYFNSAGGVASDSVARWNGSAWTAMDAGLVLSSIGDLRFLDDGSGRKLYASGWGLAVWQGSSWQSLPVGSPDWVGVLAELDPGSGNELYAMGQFHQIAGEATHHIARRRSGEWSPVTAKSGGRGLVGTISSLAAADLGAGERLVAAGGFRLAADEVPMVFPRTAATWGPQGWSGLPGIEGWIEALAVFDDGSGPLLHAAFTDDAVAYRVARLDEGSWAQLGDALGKVLELAVLDGGGGQELYAGGELPYMSRWNGADWEALGSGIGGEAWSTAVYDDGTGPALYVSGLFAEAGGAPASNIARWNGSSWSAVGTGLSFPAVDLEVFDDGTGPALYASGTFANGLARWDGETWTLPDNLPFAHSYKMVVFDDGTGDALYHVGADVFGRGLFARRESGSWTLLDNQLNGWIYDARVFDDGTGSALYLAGAFSGDFGASSFARYCSPQLFADGFESGNAAHWTAVPALE